MKWGDETGDRPSHVCIATSWLKMLLEDCTTWQATFRRGIRVGDNSDSTLTMFLSQKVSTFSSQIPNVAKITHLSKAFLFSGQESLMPLLQHAIAILDDHKNWDLVCEKTENI